MKKNVFLKSTIISCAFLTFFCVGRLQKYRTIHNIYCCQFVIHFPPYVTTMYILVVLKYLTDFILNVSFHSQDRDQTLQTCWCLTVPFIVVTCIKPCPLSSSISHLTETVLLHTPLQVEVRNMRSKTLSSALLVPLQMLHHIAL